MKAIDLISKNVPALKLSDTAATALRLMADTHLRDLPVISENQLVRMISEDDIIHHHPAEDSIKNLGLPLRRPFIKSHEHVFEVLKAAYEFRLTVIPVIDSDENYAGAVTRDDILNFFAVETGILEPGGILVIEVSVKDYTMAEVARIIEQHDAKILNAFSKTNEQSNKIELTIKISQTELQPVISSLNRYNYVVKETFTEPEYLDNLKERYDALMNYLNI